MKFILLFMVLFSQLYSQYDPFTSWFEVRIYKINNGYEVPYTVLDDDSLYTVAHYDTINPPYDFPYTSYLWRTDTVMSASDLWDGDEITVVTPLDYPRGVYEITLNTVMYMDSFWVMIDSVHTQIFDSTEYGYCTNARYVGIDTSDTPLSIEMNFFEVVLINGEAVITWITESELENCGYNIYRKERNKDEIKINPLMIAGQGSTSTSTTYGLTDPSVLMGHTYIYRLESVSCGGFVETEGRFSIFIPIEYGMFLAQNYPNPLNPTTTIEFSIDERAHLKLFLYDTRGRQSAIIRDEIMEAGEYKIGVDLSNMASGTYFYVLRSHNTRTNVIRILTKKLTLLK